MKRKKGTASKKIWPAAFRGLSAVVLLCAFLLTRAEALDKGVVDEHVLPTQFSYPVEISAGKNGQVWFISQNAHKLGVFDSREDKFREFDLPQGSAPAGLTVDAKGAPWLTLSSNPANSIASFSPETGKFSFYKVPTPGAEPYKITSDPDGGIWFTERNVNKIGQLNGKKIREYRIPTPNSQPSGITSDSRGNIWFTEAVGNNIVKIDAKKGTLREYPVPTPYSTPAGIAVDGRDKVWFVEMNGNRLVMFDPGIELFSEAIIPTVNSVPVGLALSSDGTVWFTESRANKVGSFDPQSARFNEFQIPTSSSLPIGVAVDASGRVWFTESARDANRIGSINPGAAAGSGRAPVEKEVRH